MAKKKASGETPKKTSPAAASPKTTRFQKRQNPIEVYRELANDTFKGAEETHFTKMNVNADKEPMEHISTGSTVLDYQIGGILNEHGVPDCPGIPKGRIAMVYGSEGSGKTTLALNTALETLKNGGCVLYIDWECTVVDRLLIKMGFRPYMGTSFLKIAPPNLEAGMHHIQVACESSFDLIVIDSVGAGTPTEVLNSDSGTGSLGLEARVWSAWLGRFQQIMGKTGTTILAISQTRSKINTKGYGPTKSTQGGTSWGFYASLKIELARIAYITAQKYNPRINKMEAFPVGTKVKSRLQKCKVASTQNSESEFYIRFGMGIDDVRSMIEVAKNHKYLKKSGSWYAWERSNGETLKAQGEENLRNLIIQDPSAEAELRAIVRSILGKASFGEDLGTNFIEKPE